MKCAREVAGSNLSNAGVLRAWASCIITISSNPPTCNNSELLWGNHDLSWLGVSAQQLWTRWIRKDTVVSLKRKLLLCVDTMEKYHQLPFLYFFKVFCCFVVVLVVVVCFFLFPYETVRTGKLIKEHCTFKVVKKTKLKTLITVIKWLVCNMLEANI